MQSAIINQTSRSLSVLFPKAHPAGAAHNFPKLIPLTQGEFAIVDIEDYIKLSRYKYELRRFSILKTEYVLSAAC